MKVYIDGTLIGRSHRGMAKFAEQLIEPIKSQTTVVRPEGTLYSRFPPLWEQFVLPKVAPKEMGTILVCPYNTAPVILQPTVPVVLVIHDLIFLEKASIGETATAWQQFGRTYRRLVCPRSAKKAHAIITVSDFSKKRIAEEFRIPPDRIQVIPNSIGRRWLQASPWERTESKRILSVTGNAPSKNIPRLLKGFKRVLGILPETTLIIVGIPESDHFSIMAIASKVGVDANLILSGRISEDELIKLYQTADAFVLPSLSEGFGIPILESMSIGCPVATSNTTSMPEVAANAAVYFDPYNEEEIGSSLVKLLTDASLAKQLSVAGRARAKAYSQDTIRETIANFWSQVGN